MDAIQIAVEVGIEVVTEVGVVSDNAPLGPVEGTEGIRALHDNCADWYGQGLQNLPGHSDSVLSVLRLKGSLT